jgi:hypothetical protein
MLERTLEDMTDDKLANALADIRVVATKFRRQTNS